MSTVEFTEEHFTVPAAVRTCIGIGVADVDGWALANAIAAKHGTTWRQIREDIRIAYVHAARKELCKELHKLGWTYGKIGRFIGRHHTTVMSAVKGTSELAKARKKLLWATREAAKGAA